MDLPIRGRRTLEIQVGGDLRFGRSTARTVDVRGLRRRLARPKGSRWIRRSLQQHAKVCRLEDVEEARLEQLASHQRRSCDRNLQAEKATGSGHRHPRQSIAHPSLIAI